MIQQPMTQQPTIQRQVDDALSGTIERTSDALDTVGAAERAPWLFVRCWMLTTRFEEYGGGVADVDGALADFAALPAGFAGRAKLAAVLVVAQLRAGLLRERERLERAVALAAIADADPEPLPEWPSSSAVVRALSLMVAGLDGAAGFRVRPALAEVERLAAVVGDLRPHVTMIEMARLTLTHLRGQEDTSAVDHRSGTPGTAPPEPVDLVAGLLRGHAMASRGDLAGAAVELRRILATIESFAPGDPMRLRIERIRDTMAPLFQLLESGVGDLPGC
jgi:hypothetical protein